jgi:hypothetical protein
VLALESGALRRDALELDERPGAGHLVEMDAHALPQQHAPALGHDAGRAECGAERLARRRRVGNRRQPVAALASLGRVGLLVGDEVRVAGLLLAELQTAVRRREVGVALHDDAAVLRAQGKRAAKRAPRVGVTRLELDVAAWGRSGQGPRRGYRAASWGSPRA